MLHFQKYQILKKQYPKIQNVTLMLHSFWILVFAGMVYKAAKECWAKLSPVFSGITLMLHSFWILAFAGMMYKAAKECWAKLSPVFSGITL